MTIFFTSDHHFNHQGIIKYCSRPWANVRDMNADLIRRWNAVVGPKDTTWYLGDFGFNGGTGDPALDLLAIFLQLNGYKNLVVGNHDEKNPKVLKLPWDLITPMATVRGDNKMRAMVCHYPMETWKDAQRGYLMLHGHSHGTLERELPHRFDVGVDVNRRYAPISFESLWEKAQHQTFTASDHHGK